MVQEVLGLCAVPLEEGCQKKSARGWTIEGVKRRVTRKECKISREEFGGVIEQKVCGTFAQKRMLEDRGALRKEEGDSIRELQGHA